MAGDDAGGGAADDYLALIMNIHARAPLGP
jgi:hypothetical protein